MDKLLVIFRFFTAVIVLMIKHFC